MNVTKEKVQKLLPPLPPLPKTADAELMRFLRVVKENIEQMRSILVRMADAGSIPSAEK